VNILNIESVKTYVNENIGDFHNRRISCLDSLELLEVIRRKNPYLFKAKNILTSEGIIRGIVDAYISSNEETIFGDWLEGLAIFINGEVYNGWKSGIPGIDLEFDNDGIRYGRSIGKTGRIIVILERGLVHENGKHHSVIPLQSLGSNGKNQIKSPE